MTQTNNITLYIRLSIAIMFCILTVDGIARNPADTIDNKKLAELSKMKMGDDLTIGLIHSSYPRFDCSVNAVLQLKKEGVSEKVLTEMLRVCNQQKQVPAAATNTTPVTVTSSNDPSQPHPTGIYAYYKNDTGSVLKKLYATVVSGEQAGGFGAHAASHFSYGFAKSSAKALINEPEANVKCKKSTEFYFYFEQGTAANMIPAANWWFYNATSPNEFTLITLKPVKQNREFRMGKSDSYTSSVGIDEKQKVSFTFEEVRQGIFKVWTREPLKPGEYCFLFSASVPGAYTNNKVFDFSVPK